MRDRLRNAGLVVHAALLLALATAPSAEAAGPYRFDFDDDGAPNAWVIDGRTGLTWRHCSEGQTWSQSTQTCQGIASSFTYAQALKHARGQRGWRLPTLAELASLLDKTRAYPAIDLTVFPQTNGYYWTSSTVEGDASYAWYVYFDYGYSYISPGDTPLHLRLVR